MSAGVINDKKYNLFDLCSCFMANVQWLGVHSWLAYLGSRPTKRAADSLKAGAHRLPSVLITKDLLPAKSG
jgi:hypothetical protein